MEVESPLRRANSKKQSSDLILRDVPGKGRGVFAGRDFAVGQFVLEFLGDVLDVETFDDLTYALQVGPRDFMTASGGVDDYVNHSCAPNTGVRSDHGRVILFALQPIRREEEITFDYATTQEGGYWTMNCCCKSAACRRIIGDFADLPEEVRDFYVSHSAVLPYLVGEQPTKTKVVDHKTRRG